MCASDRLLELVFGDPRIWEDALNSGLDKRIDKNLLKRFTDPEYRSALKEKLRDRKYHVTPPHEAQIPKDDGTMRTVYVNQAKDRILLTVINNVLFKACPALIHPSCKSYKTGIGCGIVVRQVSRDIQKMDLKESQLGYKVDLSKYFDSVPIQFIEKVFKDVAGLLGESAVLDLLWEYYHDDRLLDKDKKIFEKYTSLRQGCAVAAFLADAVLADIDAKLCSMNVRYYRYSDDILILGDKTDADAAFDVLRSMLAEKGLALNPKKVEVLDRSRWFTFLGFSIKDDRISLSKKRIKNLQHELEALTVRSGTKSPLTAARKVYRYLYDTSVTQYGYAEGILPVINDEHDIRMLDVYIMDLLRACATGKTEIGGIGYDKNGSEGVIVRGTGRHVRSNIEKHPKLKYHTLAYMRVLFNQDREVYETYARTLIQTN